MKAGALGGRKRLFVGGFAGVGVALAAASVSWACTVPSGYTWYSDGTFAKSGPTGTVITAFATQAKPNTVFNLVAGNAEGEPGHDGHACMFNYQNINPNTRKSSASGFIGNTTGAITNGAGTWQICFREPLGASGTIPVHFTVV